MDTYIPRIMIVGTNSGCGKTTVTCGILKALTNRNMRVMSYKCGPDYIDPMFHKTALHVDVGNLDLFMTEDNTVKHLLATRSTGMDISVIEGVMGLYDGLGGNSETASSNHLSQVTETPVILVVDGKGMSLSILALIKGYIDFMPNRIQGVILNRTSEKMYTLLKSQIEDTFGIQALGYVPPMKEAVIASRHLGLVTATEIKDIQQKLDMLGAQIEKTIDIGACIALAQQANSLHHQPIQIKKIAAHVKIGVAYDEAFCFYYQDNFELFRKMGAELVFFSPLRDKQLPEGIGALLLGGGYPELHAQALSQNVLMRESIKAALTQGMPCIAECGGFLYLLERLDGHEMASFINGTAGMTEKLVRFGYVTLEATRDNVVCKKGAHIRAHEFHYSDCTDGGDGFTAKSTRQGAPYPCIHATEALYAGYPHLHLWGNIDFAEHFLQKSIEWENKK